MSDVSPDDLTARLQGWAEALNGAAAIAQADEAAKLGPVAADMIEALSGDVARLTAQLDLCSGEIDNLNCALVDAWAERDEARALVAERDATIERLRGAVEGLLRIAPRHRMEYEHDRTVCPYCSVTASASAVLADTAPTPETHND